MKMMPSTISAAARRHPSGERVAAVGIVASDIAHDLNNLLTVITAHTELIAEGIGAGNPLHESVQAIQASAAGAAAATRTLLALGRDQMLSATADVGALIVEVDAKVRRTFGSRVDVSADVAECVWPAHVDAAQLERSLGTIAAHAIDAMPDEGAIAFRVDNVTIDSDGSRTPPLVPQGRYVSVEISCSGLPDKVDGRRATLDPLSNQRVDGWHDVSVAAVRVVSQAGGFMWLDNDTPNVVTFTILLPADEPADRARAAAAEVSAHAQEEPDTILVVDGDEALRELFVKLLKREGYRVLHAGTVEEGLRVVDAESIDLLVADLCVSGCRQDDSTVALMAANPAMKLVCTASSTNVPRLVMHNPARTRTLAKPFSSPMLVESVRALLGD